MIASPQGKRLGDHVAGTVVIHERTPAAWGWVPQMPPELAAWAATLDLAGLDDDLALAVRHFLARNRQLREPARTQLGQRLAQEVAAVTNPPPPPGTPGLGVPGRGARRAAPPGAAPAGRRRSRAAAVWPDLLAATSPRAPRPHRRRRTGRRYRVVPGPAPRPRAARSSGEQGAAPVVAGAAHPGRAGEQPAGDVPDVLVERVLRPAGAAPARTACAGRVGRP